MIRNKIAKNVVFLLLIIFVGSVFVTFLFNTYIKKADISTAQLKVEKANDEETEKSKHKAIEIYKKTEEEYKTQLKELIEGSKLGLEDTKREQKTDYNEKTQKFVDKMEMKIKTIEAEMNAIDAGEKDSTTNSYKKLVEKFLDRSDVDN